MDPIAIRPCTVAELEASPCLGALLDEYANYALQEELGKPTPQCEMYRNMEAGGGLFCLGAFQGNNLVGFLLILAPVMPHYGVRVAFVESFFVASHARKSGAGLKLLRAAEAHANTLGAAGLLVSAQPGSPLARILPRFGYREHNVSFFRGLQ